MFHQEIKITSSDFWRRRVNKVKSLKKKIVKISDKVQLASSKITELVAFKLKPHTIEETLILFAYCEIVTMMFDELAFCYLII